MVDTATATQTTRPPDTLRDFLVEIETAGELIRVSEEVDPRFEVCAALKALDRSRGPAVLFERVRGYSTPVLGNLLGTRKRLARALRADPARLREVYLERKQHRLPPQEVEDAPVQEVVVTEGIDVAGLLPVLTYHEKDVSPYITSGVCIGRDPETGTCSMGIHRIQVKGPAKLGILLISPPLAEYFPRAEQRGEPFPIAIAIGIDPAAMFAGVAWVPMGDKLLVAGSMRQSPLPVTRGVTVDLPVPARAEIVIEGRVLPGVREPEGPFGETSGYYFAYQSPVIEVTAVTHRRDPIFHAIHPMSADTFALIGPSWEAELCGQLRTVSPRVRSVYLTPESCCTHAVVCMAKRSKLEARAVGVALATSNQYLKQVTVVDGDVDPESAEDVAWAVATRFQADRDLIVLSDVPGSGIDPSVGPGVATAKHIVDATYPESEASRFDRIAVPAAAEARAHRLLPVD